MQANLSLSDREQEVNVIKIEEISQKDHCAERCQYKSTDTPFVYSVPLKHLAYHLCLMQPSDIIMLKSGVLTVKICRLLKIMMQLRCFWFFFRKKLQMKVLFFEKKKVIPRWSNQLLLNLLQRQTKVPACVLCWLCCGWFRLQPVHTLKGLYATKVTRIASL